MWSSRPHAVMPSRRHNPSPGGCMRNGRTRVGRDLTLHVRCGGGALHGWAWGSCAPHSVEVGSLALAYLFGVISRGAPALWEGTGQAGGLPPTLSAQISCPGPLVTYYKMYVGGHFSYLILKTVSKETSFHNCSMVGHSLECQT